MSPFARGVGLCMLSQVLFGVLYLFSHWMAPVSGTDVFALRVMVMLAALLLLLGGSQAGLGALDHLVRQQLGHGVRRWGVFLAGTLIVASQQWLFMWGPVNGEGVNVAIGYFLYPLGMALAARVWLKERLNRRQLLALGLAVLGVAHEVWATRSFSWASLWVCVLFPPYYLSRRVMGIPALSGLTLDLCLTVPVMLVYLMVHGDALAVVRDEPRYWLLLPALGLVSSVGMVAHLRAGLLLPFGLFALLSYTEPVLLFLAAVLVLDAPVSAGAWWTYGPIWAALMLLAWDGLRQWRGSRRVGAPGVVKRVGAVTMPGRRGRALFPEETPGAGQADGLLRKLRRADDTDGRGLRGRCLLDISRASSSGHAWSLPPCVGLQPGLLRVTDDGRFHCSRNTSSSLCAVSA